MVQVQDPRWHLKRQCPICEQGSSLLLVSCPNCKAQLMPAETVAQLALSQCPYCQRPFARCENGPANQVDAPSCSRCDERMVTRTALAASSTTAAAGASAAGGTETSFHG